MEKVTIHTDPAYNVLIGQGLIGQADQLLKEFLTDKQVLIISDQNVADAGYVDQLKVAVDKISDKTHVIVIEPGESGKSFNNTERIVRYLATHHFSRADYIIALGGGVVGDLAGFIASIYLRGIDFIQIPTTFLASIDSSVGGKTAIDLPKGKNLVGAFHQPRIVLCDTETFHTLKESVFEDGVSELIKYGAIMNSELLEDLMHRPALQKTDPEVAKYIKASVEMKAQVVHEDEFDLGIRQRLNYGHTIGHGIEQATDYKVSHGRAIAIGMVLMAKIAYQLKVAQEDYSESLTELFNKYHLLNEAGHYDFDRIKDALKNDKKRRSETINIVLPKNLGHCVLYPIDMEDFLQLIRKDLVKES